MFSESDLFSNFKKGAESNPYILNSLELFGGEGGSPFNLVIKDTI